MKCPTLLPRLLKRSPPLPRLRLRTILLCMALLLLVAPIACVYGFRLYENELIRQTESELIAQGAFIAAAFRHAITPQNPLDTTYHPITPILDLSRTPILPPRPDAQPVNLSPTPHMLQIGQQLLPMLLDASRTTLAGIRVTDAQGIVVAGRNEMQMTLAHVSELQFALQGRYQATLRQRVSDTPPPPLASISRGTGIRVFIAYPIVVEKKIHGAVLLSRSPRNILKGLYDHRSTVYLMLILLLATALLLVWLTAYAISRPLAALVQQTERYAQGEKHLPVLSHPVTQEVATLSQHLTHMANTLAERTEYIRQFTTHVSHEFKTPLTAIRGAVELLLDDVNDTHPMPPKQRQQFLSNIQKDAEHLNLLVSRLLTLAKADMQPARAGTTPFPDMWNRLTQHYQPKGLTLEASSMLPPHISLPPDISETLLTTLLDNSLQHDATRVALHVHTSPADNSVQLRLQDNGTGISSANADKLFTPFFTTKRHQGGTGLGLVIIQSLLATYQSSIHYHPSTQQGACFSIHLPANQSQPHP